MARALRRSSVMGNAEAIVPDLKDPRGRNGVTARVGQAKMAGNDGRRSTLSVQYALAAAVFLVMVLGIILLFGHLIAGSLSKRYLEDVLAGGRDEARRIAEELGGSEVKELDVVETRREMLTRTMEGDPERRIWKSIDVTDQSGKVVFTFRSQATEEVPEALASDLGFGTGQIDEQVTETENPYRISVPLGEVGNVVLNVDQAQVTERVSRLRGDLLSQTIRIAVATFATLVLAFALVWKLIQRNRRLEVERFEAEEMAALGALAANLAHEIRNPLNSINLNLELLEEDLATGDGAARDSLSSTRAEVGRLGSLVSDFLTYARPHEPDLGPVRIDSMLDEVAGFLAAEARGMGVHLRVIPGVPQASVRSDEGQLRQVLLNLVLNAVQAVRELSNDRRVVELDADLDADCARLIVRDRGDGISQEDMARVRSAFFTKRRGGSGLGLAIAERFVRAQGGRIELENLDPRGFEARVVLPIVREAVKIGE
jgi:signal transduction histidine kinase